MTPTPVVQRERRSTLVAIAALVLLPLALLAPSLLGDSVFLPFDPAKFPPATVQASATQLEAIAHQPSNSDVTEIPLLVIPELQLARQEIDDGRFPGWNPYARFGAPLFANGLAGIAYPFDWWILLHADPARGLALAAYVTYLIGALGMFAFLRGVSLQPTTALLGAIVFAFGGVMTANAHFYMRSNAFVWLPWMMLACLRLERTMGDRRIPALIGLAMTVAATWLAGFPPFAITTTAFAACYAATLLVRTCLRSGARGALVLAAWMGSGLLLGLAASGVQLAPLLEYYPSSSRDLTPPANTIVRDSFDPAGFLGWILPAAFGHPNAAQPPYHHSPLALLLHSRSNWVADAAGPVGQLQFPANYNFTEYTIYVGALSLLLVVLGIGHRPASPLRWRMLLLLVVFAVIAVAPSWLQPLYDLPGASKTPMRFLPPVAAVAMAALAALGFDALFHGTPKRWSLALTLGFGATVSMLCLGGAVWVADQDLAAAIAQRYAHLLPAENAVAAATAYLTEPTLTAGAERLLGNLRHAAGSFGLATLWIALCAIWIRPRWPRVFVAAGWSTIVWIAIELLLFAVTINTHRDRPIATDTPVQRFLAEQRDAIGSFVTIGRAAAHPQPALDLPSGLLFPERVRDVNAYAFSDPWSHRPFLELYGEGQMSRRVWPMTFPDDARLERPFFDLIGMRYVLSAQPLRHVGPRVGPRLTSPRGDGAEFFVYERPTALPRAFVVHELRELADDDSITRALVAPDLEPRRAVLVTQDVAAQLPRVPPTAGAASERTVRLHLDRPDRLVLEVDAGPPGYLILNDACLPGWSATVRGNPTEILRGNLFMRVVPIGPAASEVRLDYRPPGLRLGIALSAIALLIMLGATIRYIRSSRARPRVEVSA